MTLYIKKIADEKFNKYLKKFLKKNKIDFFIFNSLNELVNIKNSVILTNSNIGVYFFKKIVKNNNKVFFGYDLDKILQFNLSKKYNIDYVDFKIIRDIERLNKLKKEWNSERFIKKESFVHGGFGIKVCKKDIDAICKENQFLSKEIKNSPLYKFEFINGELILAWKRETENIDQLSMGSGSEKKREVIIKKTKKEKEIIKKCSLMSKDLTKNNIFHSTFDFLIEDGEFKLLEINNLNIAMWWTFKIDLFVKNYAKAVYNLYKQEMEKLIGTHNEI